MNFDIIGFENRLECHVELIKCEELKVSRRPSQVFNFKEPQGFIDAMKGKNQVVVYVGKVKDEEGKEHWKGFYYEPTDQTQSHSWSTEGRAVLPPGSIAWLDMETEFDLEWALRDLQDDFRKYSVVTKEVQAWSHKINDVDRRNKFGDSDCYKFMSVTEKEKLIEEMKLEYARLTKKELVEFKAESDEKEPLEEDDELG